MALDPALAARLQAAGVDVTTIGDPAEAWRRLHVREGRTATLLDRYDLEAASRGITVADLDPETRRGLAIEVFAIRDPTFAFVPNSDRSRLDPIQVVPYDPAWPARFEDWRRRLATALGPVARRIDHVGSTAVPGLASKPIIDVQIGVTDVDDEADYVAAIESAGVAFRAREVGHRYFRPGGDRARDVQIHVCTAGGEWQRVHLLFRDYLRSSGAVATQYGQLKARLADVFRDDRLAYNDGKSTFILRTLADAEEWAARVGWRP